jgi:hypothetical protein
LEASGEVAKTGIVLGSTRWAVAVVDEEARSLIPPCSFTDLLFHPREWRVRRHVDVDDASGIDLHDHEDLGDSKESGVLREEVAGPDFVGVIADECPMLPRDSGATDLAPGPVAPEDPEPLPVPGDDGLRLDQDQRALPARPEPPEQDPEETVAGAGPGTPASSSMGGQLLT